MNTIPRQILRVAFCLTAMFAAGQFAAAQPQEAPVTRPRMDTTPAPTQPAQGGVVMQQPSRPFYLEGAIVALVCGGAVWTVCRSSRRQ